MLNIYVYIISQWNTKVKSCSPAKLEIVENGKKKKISGYEVILADTILFPEGGRQPDDRGTVSTFEI
uniref:Alanyl-tRNA synthetase class IIc N-terminal domain-containing protein n=1 Tax=Octopus bimaculoides TaxID=37653 RepID=A0A0L8HZA1_OCTBM